MTNGPVIFTICEVKRQRRSVHWTSGKGLDASLVSCCCFLCGVAAVAVRSTPRKSPSRSPRHWFWRPLCRSPTRASWHWRASGRCWAKWSWPRSSEQNSSMSVPLFSIGWGCAPSRDWISTVPCGRNRILPKPTTSSVSIWCSNRTMTKLTRHLIPPSNWLPIMIMPTSTAASRSITATAPISPPPTWSASMRRSRKIPIGWSGSIWPSRSSTDRRPWVGCASAWTNMTTMPGTGIWFASIPARSMPANWWPTWSKGWRTIANSPSACARPTSIWAN